MYLLVPSNANKEKHHSIIFGQNLFPIFTILCKTMDYLNYCLKITLSEGAVVQPTKSGASVRDDITQANFDYAVPHVISVLFRD